MLKYPHYEKDGAIIITMLAKHRDSGQEGISGYLLEAASIACRYLSKMVKEEDFFKWLDAPDNRSRYLLQSQQEFRRLIVPQVKELLEHTNHSDPTYIDNLGNEIERILIERKASTVRDGTGTLEKKVNELRKEVCAEERLATLDYQQEQSAPAQEDSALTKRRKKRIRSGRFKRKMGVVGWVVGMLSGLATIYTTVEDKIPAKDNQPKIEQSAPPKKEIAPGTFDMTKDVLKESLWQLPPLPDDKDDGDLDE